MSIEFLAEMAWKSALIAAGALAIAALLKSRSPNERAAVLRTAIALILMLPVLTWLLPALEIVTSAAPEPAAPATLTPEMLAAMAAAPAQSSAAPIIQDDPTPLILFAWLGGMAMVGFRLLAGLWTLRRWTRTASEVECPEWLETFEMLGGQAPAARGVRLLVADVPSPLGWGWLNPVILIDRDTIRDPGEAEAVLAHELAHVERRDWLVMILARIAVAIFWFNPLMWLLERHLVDEGEQAADARALARVEPARYAQTLLSCARHYPGLPATAIADSGLARRVRAVLEGKVRDGGGGSRGRAWAAALLCILFAAPVAALKPVAAAPEAAPVAPPAPGAPAAPVTPPAPMSASVPSALSAPAAPPALPAPLALIAGVPSAPAPFPAAAPLPPSAPRPFAMLHQAPPAPPAPAAPRHDADDDDDHDYDVDVDVDVDDVVDSAEIEREIREAMADAARDAAEAGRETARAAARVRVQAHAVGRDARMVAAHAREAARQGMAAGAAGMAQGARGMEQGARGMEAEADRLRSQAYRAEQIARAARRGEKVTDAELLALIPKLRNGAEGLRRGAEDMRRSAERMRDGRH